MKIKFLIDVVVQNAKRPAAFNKGQVVDLPADSARHWIDRGKAVEVVAVDIETATVQAPERAVRKQGNPKTVT